MKSLPKATIATNPVHLGRVSRTFPVIEDHPAYSDRGAGVDSMVDEIDGVPGEQPETVEMTPVNDLLALLRDVSHIDPRAPAVLIEKLYNQKNSIRSIGRKFGIPKSSVDRIAQSIKFRGTRLAQIIAGYQWKSSRSIKQNGAVSPKVGENNL